MLQWNASMKPIAANRSHTNYVYMLMQIETMRSVMGPLSLLLAHFSVRMGFVWPWNAVAGNAERLDFRQSAIYTDNQIP